MDQRERSELGARIRKLRNRYALSQEKLAERVGVARNTVSRWELGQHEPRSDELGRICSTFGVAVEDLVPVASSDVDRRDFLRNIAGIGLAGLAGLDPAWSLADIERMNSAIRRQKVDVATVASIESIARSHQELYFRLGSLEMLELVQGHVRTTMMLRQGDVRADLRQRLATVITEEAGHAAWHAYDLGRTPTSESFYAVADNASGEASRAVSALVKAYKSIVRANSGHVREALALAEDASESSTGADPSLRSWIAAMAAQAAASAQDRPRAEQALARAEAALNEAARQPGNRLFWLDAWRLAAISGTVYERLGDANQAEEHIRPALPYLAQRSPRGQSEMLLDLAGIALLKGEAAEAIQRARDSLARARDAQSEANLNRVRQFRVRLHPMGRRPDLTSFDEELVAV